MLLKSNLPNGNIPTVKDFVDWLETELTQRNMSRAELSKRGGISAPQVTRVLNREQKPGPDFCTAAARALHLPPETVFRAAGLLPTAPEEEEMDAATRFVYRRLSEQGKKQVRDFMRFVYENEKKPENQERPSET